MLSLKKIKIKIRVASVGEQRCADNDLKLKHQGYLHPLSKILTIGKIS